MSGHSKWHSIRHKKAANDAKRGKVFTKLIKEITVAARQGGGNPDMNPRLRLAIQKAKEENMPSDNIDRAIKKGTGELEGVNYEEFNYEGYGPDGVAIMMDIMTDNKNRTAAEIRKILSKNGGNLGESGCVSWIFEKKGTITVDKTMEEDEIMEIVLDAGAEDLITEDDCYVIYTEPDSLETVANTIKEQNIKINSSNVERIPKTTIKLSGEKAEKVENLLEILEDHDDVQNVSANYEIE